MSTSRMLTLGQHSWLPLEFPRQHRLESGKVERRSAQEPRLRGLFSRLKASRLYGWFVDGAMINLKPVSNGLFFRLQPRRQMIPAETEWG